MSKQTVKMSYPPGPVRRIIHDHEWSETAGWTQDVDLELAAELLTSPSEMWEIAERPSDEVRQALADRLGVPALSIVVPGKPAEPDPERVVLPVRRSRKQESGADTAPFSADDPSVEQAD